MYSMLLLYTYVIGFIIALLIYDVYIYEKYSGDILKKLTKKDIYRMSFCLLSWIYIIYVSTTKIKIFLKGN